MENSSVPQDWKRSVFIPIPKKSNVKECANYNTITLISHASKVMIKIIQASLQQYMNQELPDIQAVFRKGRGTRGQIANTCWILERKELQQKPLLSFIDDTKTLDCVDYSNLWKVLKTDENTRLAYLSPEKLVCRSRSNHWNLTWKNGLVQYWERNTTRLYIVTLFI